MNGGTCEASEQISLRGALRVTRESLIHLSLNPRCSLVIARAVIAVESLSDEATWQDRGFVARLADRMAAILRSAALENHGVEYSDLAIVHRLLKDAITHDTTRSKDLP